MMNKRLQQIRQLFSPSDKRKLAGIIVLMAVAGIMEMAGIGLLAGVVAIFFNPENPRATAVFSCFKSIFPDSTYNTFIISAVGSVVLLLIVKNIFSLFIIALQSNFLRSRQNAISCRLFKNFLNADYRNYITRTADEYSGVLERIKRTFDNFFSPALQLCADMTVIGCLSFAALVILPWSAIAVLLLTIIMAWVISKCFNLRNQRLGEEYHQLEREENKLRFNVLLGMEQIKISGAGDNFLRRFTRASTAICRRAASLYTLGQIPRLALESIALLLVCAVFAILLFSGVSQERIILTFTVIVAAMARMLPALSRAHYNLTQLKQYGVLLDELSGKLLGQPQEKFAVTTGNTDFSGDIVVEKLNFSYDGKNPVLKDFSCQIPAGKITGISGRSGSGKTTLINLLSSLFQPDSGVIKAGGTDISENIRSWRSQLAYVPQNVFVFDGTLRENIALGCNPEEIDDKKIIEALKSAQLAEFSETPDMMLNSRTGLSGGQKQRVGIARALYASRKVLILDEATSALDQTTETEFLKVLENLRGKVTVIVISHRPETMAVCDKIISL